MAECCIQYNQKPDQAVEVMKELEPENPWEEDTKVATGEGRLRLRSLSVQGFASGEKQDRLHQGLHISSDSKEKWDNDQRVHHLLLELEISVLVKLAYVSLGDNDPFNAVYHAFEALSSPHY